MFMENCYLIGSVEKSEAVLIDPGEEADLFLRRLDHEKLELRQIWLTHGHVDHLDGVHRVCKETGAEIYLHPEDRMLYDAYGAQRAKYGLQATETPPPPHHDLSHGDELGVGEFTYTVRHVPGHSKGGVAFVGHGAVFCGDALFTGSIGRTDLPGGDMDTLLTSIREQLLSLPDDTVVYPGHGPETTVGTEKRTNPFLTGAYGRF
jgi:glyoxylase-like metal-dependent hydrolase (beta-lactamase superfamily II)